MAFFTRVNTNVPFLLPEQCHSEVSSSSQLETNSQGITNEVRDQADGGESQKKEESGRYEYVVDRVLGVEV